MTAETQRIERTFYASGQVESETPYVGDKVCGVIRRWHSNGVLQSETPKVDSLDHGVGREWDSNGQLVSTSEYEHGTGVFRGWYPDGRLRAETWVKNRIPHGRQRVWDENGELIVESFYISARKVSKKKYFDASAADSTLPRYDANDSPPTWADLYPEPAVDAPMVSAADTERARDALAWLASSSNQQPRTLGELESTAQSIELVKEFLAAGAKRVLVVDIQSEEDIENSGALLVELPKKGAARERALDYCNEQNQLRGFSPQKDAGQQFVQVALD